MGRSAKDAKKAKAPKQPDKPKKVKVKEPGSRAEKRLMKKIAKLDVKESKKLAKELIKRKKKIERKQNTIIAVVAILITVISRVLDELIKKKKQESEA